MAKRKTYEVEKLRLYVNKRLASDSLTPEARLELATLLEVVLLDTGNYKGFNYLGWLSGGFDAWMKEVDLGADASPEMRSAHNYPEGLWKCDVDKDPFIGDKSKRIYF